MEESLFELTDRWLATDGPQSSVVVSCRTRFARNLAGLPFPPRATNLALKRVADTVKAAITQCELFQGFHSLAIDAFNETDRLRLRESQVISQEMERGGKYRLVFLGADPITTIMVNEEDHLRFFVIMPGLQIAAALQRLIEVEEALTDRLQFAFSETFGYLTACPTNTGTALRASVMLHLPALALTEELASLLESVPNYGIAVRGYYGENSAHLGDFYQISNDTTLGRAEDQIVERLLEVIKQIVGREQEARARLFHEQRVKMEDMVFRALSVLSNSRLMTTQEAIKLLSVVRLGIDRGIVPGLNHSALSRLIVHVQPAHLQHMHGGPLAPEKRDVVRANMLRGAFSAASSEN